MSISPSFAAKTLIGFCLVFSSISQLFSIESPTSDGEVALLEAPVFRVPFMKNPPKIDGEMGDKEWEDASALSGFWVTNYVRTYPAYEYQASEHLQSQVFAAYDKDNLYMIYRVKVYPEDAWLKANGRFPDVYNHPLYGVKQDDHIEFELRPYKDNRVGYELGMYKWFVNPISTMSDQYWSLKEGLGKRWQSKAKVRAGVESDWWSVEMAIPFKEMKQKLYAGKDDKDRDLMPLPPPDGSTYRYWFKNGIGGFSPYVILFDQHSWNTTKGKIILDSDSVSFQVNQLGPLMDDIIDVHFSLKNHSNKSQSVRLGFFVENEEAIIFTSYEENGIEDGMVELLPGEQKKFKFKKKFPGISKFTNFFWVDIRSSGRPAKVIYQNRLAKFHASDATGKHARWRQKLDIVKGMRPPKVDFDFKYQYSPYTNKIAAFVDKGIYGAPDEVKQAVEARLTLMDTTEDENTIFTETKPFVNNFATFMWDKLEKLELGEYKVSLILFDENTQIVGEREPKPFYKGKYDFEKNQLGLEDIVWEPFTAIDYKDGKVNLLKHQYTLDPSGLPAQHEIKADLYELPLEARKNPGSVSETHLSKIGRGKQLRGPFRFEASRDKQLLETKVVSPYKVVRQWKSELELESKLKVGPLDVDVNTRYDVDGTLHVKMTYGSKNEVELDDFSLVMDVAGIVDIRVGGGWGMQPASGMDIVLSNEEGVVWDSAKHEHFEEMELYYSKFVPWLHFGSGDRAWTWICDSDRDWIIDRESTTMTLTRNKEGQVSWRANFINHKAKVKGTRTIEFEIIVNPTKPKPAGFERSQWLDSYPSNYAGQGLECLPNDGVLGIDGSDETFEYFKKRYPNGAPRLYIVKNWLNKGTPPLAKGSYSGEWWLNSSIIPQLKPMDLKGGYDQPWTRPGDGTHIEWGSRSWEDYFVYHCERMVRIGKVPGYWWDEFFPPIRTNCLANGQAYFRDPKEIRPKELPFQSNFGTMNGRRLLKRIARLQTKNNVPVMSSFWANSSAITLEAFGDSSELHESCMTLALSYDIDNIKRFPISVFRLSAGFNRGHYVRINPLNNSPKGFCLTPGDELRFDRGVIGRALLHNMGVSSEMTDPEQLVNTLNILHEFGYFDGANTEVIPYWRSSEVCRFGENFEQEGAFEVSEGDPFAKTYVTVYRRPYESYGGRQGYKVLFVILNERDNDVRGRLHILDSKRLFGAGKNNITTRQIYRNHRLPMARTTRGGGGIGADALIDLERRGAVARNFRSHLSDPVRKEIYGRIHVRSHDFKLIYGHYNPIPPKNRKLPKRVSNTDHSDLGKDQPWWINWKKVPTSWNLPAKK